MYVHAHKYILSFHVTFWSFLHEFCESLRVLVSVKVFTRIIYTKVLLAR